MNKNIQSIIEAILFATGDAVHINSIASTINMTQSDTLDIMLSLIKYYNENKSGIIIIQIDDEFQMCTNPLYSSYLRHLYTSPTKSLSPRFLETLAIIVYKQPITKSQIEYIRGTNSDSVVNSLVKYGLIEEKGRLDAVGKPMLFGTTPDFLKYFGVSSISELPPMLDDDAIKDLLEDL